MTSSSDSQNLKNLLLIFTRNPELGKCKTRLAAKVGDHTALEIYTFLLDHTHNITKGVSATKEVHYSEKIWENDIWENTHYYKKTQQGKDLGDRMLNAFHDGFEAGYKNIIIIGSDMYDLSSEDLNNAFEQLNKSDFVIGPAEDGGYYLLGMSKITASLFKNKAWGTPTVLKDTLNDLKNESVRLLKIKNDVDLYEDIQYIEAFQPFLKNIKI
ncbi:MAG: TIGR04282 family arsenosugar biosynthesis glycosyltransferase [Flavobacteriales bacterium]